MRSSMVVNPGVGYTDPPIETVRSATMRGSGSVMVLTASVRTRRRMRSAMAASSPASTPGQQDGEFFAAPPGGVVELAYLAFDGGGDGAQDLVSGEVTVCV